MRRYIERRAEARRDELENGECDDDDAERLLVDADALDLRSV